MNEPNLKIDNRSGKVTQNTHSSGYWQYSGFTFKPHTPQHIRHGKAEDTTIAKYITITDGVEEAKSFWDLCIILRQRGVSVKEAYSITKQEFLLRQKFTYKPEQEPTKRPWYYRLCRFFGLS